MSLNAPSPQEPELAPRGNVLSRASASLRRSRDFRFLLLSNVFFFGGNWAGTLVLSWLVFESTGSELLLALFTAARLAPMWLGPLSGLMADRFDRVHIIFIASMWSVFMAITLGIFAAFEFTPFWLLLIGGFLMGLAQSPSQPARFSLSLQLVGRKSLANANALNSMAFGLTQAVAPAVGGVVLSQFGASIALWYTALWYLAAGILVWQVKVAHQKIVVEHEPVLPMIADGLRVVLRNRLTTTVIVITLAANVLIWPVYNSFMAVFASDVLNLGPDGLGRLMACVGVGNFFGSFLIASLGDFRFKGGVFVVGSTIWGLGFALFGLSETAPLSYALLLAIGVLGAAFGVLQATLMLMTTAAEVQGRALGILELAIGSMPIGTLLLGAVANTYGVGPTTFVAGMIFVLILVGHTLRVPDLVTYTGHEPEIEAART